MFGEWKLQAGRGGLGMSGAACVRVSGVRDDLSSGLGRGLRFGAGAREPFWRGDLGAVGEQGAGGLGRSVTPHPGPAAPFAWLSCPGWGVGRRGADRRLGGCSRPGGFFSVSSPASRPAYLRLCLFAGCLQLADPHPHLSDRVKTGTLLTIDEDNKSPHAGCAARRSSTSSPPSADPPFSFC